MGKDYEYEIGLWWAASGILFFPNYFLISCRERQMEDVWWIWGFRVGGEHPDEVNREKIGQ